MNQQETSLFSITTQVGHERVTAEFEVRPGTTDIGIVKEVWEGKFYIPRKEFEIKPGMTIIDVGSQIGSYAVLAMRLGAKVYAFEPNPENYTICERNIERNTNPDDFNGGVVFYKEALLGERKTTYLILNQVQEDGKINTGSSFVDASREDGQEVQGVGVNDLIDRIIQEHGRPQIDILKLDCENSEYEILHGIKDTNYQYIDKIVLETHCGVEKGKTLVPFLEERGYQVNFVDINGDLGKLFAIKLNK